METKYPYLVLVHITKLMKKVLIKNAISSTSDVNEVFPFIGYLRVRERQSLLLYPNHFIGIVYFTIANNKHYFIIIASFIGYCLRFTVNKRLEPEHIEMTYLITDILWHPIKFPLIHFFYCFALLHVLSL